MGCDRLSESFVTKYQVFQADIAPRRYACPQTKVATKLAYISIPGIKNTIGIALICRLEKPYSAGGGGMG